MWGNSNRSNAMLPRGPWNCDHCRKTVEMKDAWVEYRTGKDGQSYGLQIAHHVTVGEHRGDRCSYDSRGGGGTIASFPLSDVLGHDGLVELLKMQKYDNLPADEVSLMIRRLHTPGYEQARSFFETAVREKIILPPSTPGFFNQEDIQAVWRHYRIQNLNTPRQGQTP